jgi:hypothetical protein
MTLYDMLIAEFPELEGTHLFADGTITLQDDSDGTGAYIKEWNYSKPIPSGMKLGK